MHGIRVLKAILVGTIGVFACLVSYNNVVDYGSNWAFVQHVLAMDTVFPDNAVKATRAINDVTLQRIAYWAIIVLEGLIGVVCVVGAFGLYRRSHDRRAFIAAKTLPACGLVMMWLLYFVGFIVVGGEWFAMWQSTIWNGQEKAAMFLMCAMFVLVLLLIPEQDNDR